MSTPSPASLDEYKISSEILGHTLDVRSVCQASADTLISGSRDKTARIWHLEG